MYHFIVNPNSRSGNGLNAWHIIEKTLKAQNIDYTLYMTNHRYHATEICKSITRTLDAVIIIVIGGDGTVNEVLNGIINFKNVTLGYIPAGSSNDLARCLEIPSEPLKALELILNPKYYSLMDIGIVTYGKNSRRFCVSTGIGLDAAICHEALDSKLKNILNKFHLGKLTYVGIGLKQIVKLKPCNATILLDNNNKLKFNNIYFAGIFNNQCEGGGFKFCPNAHANDGKLDLIIINDISKLSALFLLPFAHAGKHTKHKGVNAYQCKNAEIYFSRKSSVHTDGESCFYQHRITASCDSDKLKIITSRSLK